MGKIFCKNCGKELNENEKPCSSCGCKNRIYHEVCEVSMKLRISSKWKHKRPGFKRPIAEGLNLYKKSRDPKLAGQEVEEVQIVDREKNKWRHIIKDVATGKIIHKENKRLDVKK